MKDNKQELQGGDHSANYQANRDITVHQGMAFAEVKDVAMMVFENNFLKLGEQVEELVNQRAEKIIVEYLDKLRSEKPEALANTIDPDIRAVIYEAQKDYARSGKEDTEKLLVDLLFERTVEVQSDFKNIVLNEALSVASKLSKLQIDLLSISYLGKYISFNQLIHPSAFEHFLEPFQYLFDSKFDAYSDYSFLTYLGCMDISIGSLDFDKMISSKNLSGLASEDEVRMKISDYPLLSKMRFFWNSNERSMQNATTTPVGNVIATVNINRHLGSKEIPFIL